jgi:predicted permease
MYLYIFIGFLGGKIFKNHQEQIRTIGAKLVLWIISPLQIFIVLTTSNFELSFSFVIQIILIATGLYALTTVSSFLYLRNKEIPSKKMGTYLLLIAFPNIMFFSIPIILAIFSEELIIISVIYASTVMVLRGSISTYLSEKYGSERSMRIKDVFIKLFTFPPFIAVIAGVLVLLLQIPLPISIFLIIKPPINLISSAIGSLLIGIILAYIIKEELKLYWSDIKNVLIWRLGISAIFYMSIVYFLRFDPLYQTEIRTILLIIVLGPSAVFSVIFSIYFDLDEKFAAITVATVTLITLIILPILIIFGLNLF